MDKNRLAVFRHFVEDLATLSKCSDKHTATIITDRDGSQVYSIGINGGPKGGSDCLCNGDTKYTCVHAEANALAKCMTHDPYKVAICLLSPCVTCASLMVNCGVKEVYYIQKYKDDTAIQILKNSGVRVVDISDQGITESNFNRLIDKLKASGYAVIHCTQRDLFNDETIKRVEQEANKLGVVHFGHMDETRGYYVIEWRGLV